MFKQVNVLHEVHRNELISHNAHFFFFSRFANVFAHRTLDALYLDDPYLKNCIHIRKVNTIPNRMKSITFFSNGLV